MLDVQLNATEQMLVDAVRGALSQRTTAAALGALEASARGYDETLWSDAGSLGWLSVLEDGEQPLNLVNLGLVLSEMGRHAVPLPYLQSMQAQLLVRRHFDAADAVRWTGDLATGARRAVVAWRHAQATVPATPSGDSAVIDAGPFLVEWAGQADWIACPIHLDRAGRECTVALVRADAPGVSIEPVAGVIDNERVARVRFTQARAEAIGHVTPREDIEASLLLLDLLRSCELAGGAASLVDMTAGYMKVRHQFNRPLGSLQAVQHACADMLMLADAAWLTVFEALWRAERGLDWRGHAATAIQVAAHGAEEVALRASQLHAGVGYIKEHVLHQFFRRARGQASRLGTLDFRLETIARETLVRGADGRVRLCEI